LERGVFAEVTYRPVEEIAGESPNTTLARAAATRVHDADHVTAGSRLLVRTDSVADAKRLASMYDELDTPLGVIVHTTSWPKAQRMREEVEAGSLWGFVCVGSLTEGFDFPAFKVAAYHAPHKTLGPTLQYIGRLARVGEIGGRTIRLATRRQRRNLGALSRGRRMAKSSTRAR
jgi:superfamily II DNA or RNA helicase